MTQGDNKKVVSFRIRPDTHEWLKSYAERERTTPSMITSDLLDALRDRRLIILAAPQDHYINQGNDPAIPVLVCLNPR